jgi:ComF family protein
MVYNWLNFSLFHERFSNCRLCAGPADRPGGLCHACLADLPHNHHPCPRCGAVLTHVSATPCGECQRQPPQFDHAHIPYYYAPPLIPFIIGLKFQGRLADARLLGDLFLASLDKAEYPLPECLIPVPLHPIRLRERGFNQALELARPISQQLNLPLEPHVVQRRLHTRPQSELSGVTRRRNLRRAFHPAAPIPYQHVALIDDVVTTGSTLNELAKVLRQTGVKTIQIWAIARA